MVLEGRSLTYEKALCTESDDIFAEEVPSEFVVRCGSCCDIGRRRSMEDAVLVKADLLPYIECDQEEKPESAAYAAVFDGHCGAQAALHAQKHLLRNILSGSWYSEPETAMRKAFGITDQQIKDSDDCLGSGTTALVTLVLNRVMHVANLGDCRIVLCRAGKGIELSDDHRTSCEKERIRIEKAGGFIDDGYVNGIIGVTRALGDWDSGLKDGEAGVHILSAEPEYHSYNVSDDDEFAIIACDGLWEVFSSQNAVDMARKFLRRHNDPRKCSEELVAEALRRDTTDNVSVIVVCLRNTPPPVAKCPSRQASSEYTPPHMRRALSNDALKTLVNSMSEYTPSLDE